MQYVEGLGHLSNYVVLCKIGCRYGGLTAVNRLRLITTADTFEFTGKYQNPSLNFCQCCFSVPGRRIERFVDALDVVVEVSGVVVRHADSSRRSCEVVVPCVVVVHNDTNYVFVLYVSLFCLVERP